MMKRAPETQRITVPEGDMPRRSQDEAILYGWDEETSGLVDWFLAADLKEERFLLTSGVEVTEAAKFYQVLKHDIGQGVEGARARTGALQEDLRALFDLFGNEEKRPHP